MPIRLLAIAFAGGDPLTPFVIGEEGAGDDDSDNDGEKDFHGAQSVDRVPHSGQGDDFGVARRSYPHRTHREAAARFRRLLRRKTGSVAWTAGKMRQRTMMQG